MFFVGEKELWGVKKMPLEVIFEDNHQLVVNKPGGLLTQPSGTEQDSLEAMAKNWIKDRYQKPGNVFLEAIHRLDKPVSGVVLFARTSKALGRLQASMRDKRSHKLYLAVVEGVPSLHEAMLEHYLMHDDYQSRIVQQNEPNAKLARLHYRIIGQKGGQSILEVILDTGRYHQIRAQLSAIGHPILGDVKYGSRSPYLPGFIALHHYCLQVPHPITDEMQTFKAPLPPTWP
jgi:23S rRNA pseudouridine1911/1915/1917 synthase